MKPLDPKTKKILSKVTSTVYLLRAEREWSQRTLAIKANINHTTIAKTEIGDQCYSLPSLLAITKAFKITLAHLFERAEL